MTKLISAEEARAMSGSDDIERHLYHINQQIRFATQHHDRSVGVSVWECTEVMAARLSGRLQGAGYGVRYNRSPNGSVWFVISW
jgi:hypothetical protein